MKKGSFYGLIKINVKAVLGVFLCAVLCAAAAVTVRAVTAAEGVEVPVVMYHAVLKDPARHGKYVISPAEFENDIQYLQKHGYTTVFMDDLIAYTRDPSYTLPEKPVLLTFDDGYYNNYLYAFETAKRYRAKFVLSPICYYTDLYTDNQDENAYYSHATWGELEEMADSGLVEIQNHSYNLHGGKKNCLGVQKRWGESEEQYKTRLTADVTKAQEEIEAHVGVRPTTFVYPFGAVSKATPEIIRELGFSATLSCEERVSRVTRDPESLYDMGRFLRVSGESPADFFGKKMGLK